MLRIVKTRHKYRKNKHRAKTYLLLLGKKGKNLNSYSLLDFLIRFINLSRKGVYALKKKKALRNRCT